MSDVIANAIAEYRESGSSSSMDSLGNEVFAPAVESPAGSDTSPSDTPAAGSETAAAPAATTPVEQLTPQDGVTPPATPGQDEIDKLLQAEGVEAKSIRGENRIPYSRTKGIIANAQKKWEQEKLTPLQEKVTQAESRLGNYQAQERLASDDPDRFIAALAAVDPRYQKFLQPQQPKPAEGAQSTVPAAENDPEPQPDKDPQTGQLYYSEKKWQEVQAWNRRQAVREAEARIRGEFEKQYGPVLQSVKQEHDARQAYQQRAPVIAAQIQRVNDIYGAELVKKHENEIAQVLKDAQVARQPLSLAEAAAKVLTPKLRASEAEIRQRVIADMNKRPAAASSTTPSNQQVVGTTAPKTTTDKIKALLDERFPDRAR